MRSIALLTLCLFPLHLSAQCPDWKPDIRFELDGLEELANGEVSFHAKCDACGFDKKYMSVPAEEAEEMMKEGAKLLEIESS